MHIRFFLKVHDFHQKIKKSLEKFYIFTLRRNREKLSRVKGYESIMSGKTHETSNRKGSEHHVDVPQSRVQPKSEKKNEGYLKKILNKLSVSHSLYMRAKQGQYKLNLYSICYIVRLLKKKNVSS